jgi:hypothetical protein
MKVKEKQNTQQKSLSDLLTYADEWAKSGRQDKSKRQVVVPEHYQVGCRQTAKKSIVGKGDRGGKNAPKIIGAKSSKGRKSHSAPATASWKRPGEDSDSECEIAANDLPSMAGVTVTGQKRNNDFGLFEQSPPNEDRNDHEHPVVHQQQRPPTPQAHKYCSALDSALDSSGQ